MYTIYFQRKEEEQEHNIMFYSMIGAFKFIRAMAEGWSKFKLIKN